LKGADVWPLGSPHSNAELGQQGELTKHIASSSESGNVGHFQKRVGAQGTVQGSANHTGASVTEKQSIAHSATPEEEDEEKEAKRQSGRTKELKESVPLRWTFDEYLLSTCASLEDDLLRDYQASLEQCMQKCWDLGPTCTGLLQFTEDTAGNPTGMCNFMTGVIQDASGTKEKVNCYKRMVLETTTTTTSNLLADVFDLADGQTCSGDKSPLVVNFEAARVPDCMDECWRLGRNCSGFVIDNPPPDPVPHGRGKESKCTFLSGHMSKPRGYSAGSRDCYTRTEWTTTTTTTKGMQDLAGQHMYAFSFKAHKYNDCSGNEGDLEVDYIGSVGACMHRCWKLGPGCKGFIRVSSGSSKAGKCDFRAGALGKALPTHLDVRTCYKRLSYDPDEARAADDLPSTTSATTLFRSPFDFPSAWGKEYVIPTTTELAPPEIIWQVADACNPGSLDCNRVCSAMQLKCKKDRLSLTSEDAITAVLELAGRYCRDWVKTDSEMGSYFSDGTCAYNINPSVDPTCEMTGQCDQKRVCPCGA